jgi:S-adenosylmethionine decarboxylase proenzyme
MGRFSVNSTSRGGKKYRCQSDRQLLSAAPVVCIPAQSWNQLTTEANALNTRGQHLLAEYTGCDLTVLDDLERIETLMKEAAIAARTRVVASVFQPFHPQGVSGVVVIEESHLSIHTWPEHGYASVDFFTCGQGLPERAHEVLRKGLKARRSELMMIDRGMSMTGRSMNQRFHQTEKHNGGVAPWSRSRQAALRIQL